MYCLHPISVRKWYDPSPEHALTTSSGKVHFVRCDMPKKQSSEYHLVPCGKCIACLSRRRNEWTYRLTQENNHSDYSFFGTLTYSDENIPQICTIEGKKQYLTFYKLDVQRFIKRVRYFISKIAPEIKCTYFAVSEYGSVTHRPHYHYLFFVKNDKYHKQRKQIEKILRECWFYGFSVVAPPSPARIHYVTKYCLKGVDKKPDDCFEDVFTLCSKASYIGSGHYNTLESQADNSAPDPVVFFNGNKQAMPRIYRNKLGLAGMPNEMYDERLTMNQYNVMRARYLKSHSSFDQADFAVWCNLKLKQYEQLARERQLKRQEKL